MNIDVNIEQTKKYISSVSLLLEGKSKKAYVLTFGCQQNEADSEKIRSMAKMMGYDLTDNADEAELVVVNTCAVREHAELKALSVVGKFKANKTANPDVIIAVVGCMAAEAHMAEKIKKSYRFVSFTLEPSSIHRFPEMLYRTLVEKKRSFIFGSGEETVLEGIEPTRASLHRAWVSIMYGCNNFCSYCIVPYVRGRERSRASADIISECQRLVSIGYREITLLGQNVNSYRSDIDFASLLEKIANIPGDFIIRFMTSHPKDVSDRLIEVFGKYSGKIAPHFHLPLQSGSDRILSKMNRTYDRARYLSIVEKLRYAVPGVALTSDIIVGFPEETEADFQDTMAMLREVEFDMVYSFIYSPREGTRASVMDGQIDDEVKTRRMTELLEVQGNISKSKNQPYLDTVQRVLVDSFTVENGKKIYDARTMSGKLVHFEYDKDIVGEFKNVKITKAGAFALFGEIYLEK